MIEKTFLNPTTNKQWRIEIDGHMATVTGGKKAFRRSQRIWMPMKLWKIRSWRNTT